MYKDLVNAIRKHARSRSDVHRAMYEVFGPPSGSPALEFLERELKKGPQAISELRELAEKEGIRYMTLRQAAVRLGNRLSREIKGNKSRRQSIWSLRDDD